MPAMRVHVVVAAALLGALAADASAEDPDPAAQEEAPEYHTVVVATGSRRSIVTDQRAVTVVDGAELAAARTASEALHGVPGVSVQKTNHAGGSPYLRGRTGQQTLVMVDGFRLNTSIMRAGPNQYLATVPIGPIDRIEVLRGAGSVLYGSDAIGGVVNVLTREPGRQRTVGLTSSVASADRAAGGYAHGQAWVGEHRFRGGLGGHRINDLRGGGPIALASAPDYAGDRQRFTGYDDLAHDARVALPLLAGELTVARMGLTQFDAPRTDKCRAEPYQCRFFERQAWDLTYLRWTADRPRLREIDLGLAYARTHEVRRSERTDRDTVRETDTVHTLALTGRASSRTFRRGTGALRLSAGGELYLDGLSSSATTADVASVRGKYLDGSSYLSTAAFAFAEWRLDPRLGFTAGARLSAIRAGVTHDPETGAPAFTQTNLVPVASAGVRLEVTDQVAVVGNLDQGFRAPNLDDLTARSDEGPGFQLPSAGLEPERSVTVEGGVLVRERGRGRAALFGYQTWIDGAITRTRISCPLELAASCGEAEVVYRLANARGSSIHGLEADGELTLPAGITLRATVVWTVASTLVTDAPDVPEAKIPPLHGTAAVRFALPRDTWVESLATWAVRQDRLAPADLTDSRIPAGGTPGYGILDVRTGSRLSRTVAAGLTIHNLTDTPYRVHGSGVDGAGVGVLAWIDAALR